MIPSQETSSFSNQFPDWSHYVTSDTICFSMVFDSMATCVDTCVTETIAEFPQDKFQGMICIQGSKCMNMCRLPENGLPVTVNGSTWGGGYHSPWEGTAG